ncbi:FHA domain-containing protein [Nocardia sp. NPDC004722]
MAQCPDGHESLATDYCDVCGMPIVGGSASPAARFGAATPAAALCPACGAPSEGRFCENCGHDSALPTPPPAPPVQPDAPSAQPDSFPAQPDSASAWAATEGATRNINDPAATVLNNGSGTVWVATVTADPAHYARMQAQKGPDLERVEFPDYYPDRRIPLQGPNVLIGKRSASQGLHPEIDLSVAPADIAVSRSHAILHIDGDGVTVTDLGSTNGTCLNDSPEPIPPKTAVPVYPGDRIHVGGWTTITLSTDVG